MKANIICTAVGAVLLLVLAVFSQSLMPLLLMVAFLLLVAGSLCVQRLGAASLSASFEMEELAEKNQSLKGQLIVYNRGRIPFPVVRAIVETNNLLTGEKTVTPVPVGIGPRGAATSTLTFSSAYCGRLKVSVSKLKIYDFFGLVSLPVKVEGKKKALILPELYCPDVVVAKSGVTEPECDSFSPYKAGNDPSETFAIRDYEPGDSLRSVHWKLTGKFDRLVVRESSLPMNESVLILFERMKKDDEAFAAPEVRNAMGQILLSLSNQLAEMNLAHTIGWLRAENGTFIGHRVDSEESFQLVMAEVLSVSEISGEDDTVEGFLKTNDHDSYSNIVYVTAHSSEHLSLLPLMARKTMILCGKEETDIDLVDGTVYTVTPDNYETALYEILI